eukprot:g32174.t1
MEGFTYEHHCGIAPTMAAARPRVKAKATPAEQLGIVPRAVVALFDRIYNEKIFDLLNPSSTVSQREAGGRGEEFSGLRLRWDAARRHFFVENLFQYECSSAEEALQHYQQGIQNKQVASTTMNVASSRSHTLLVLTLLRREGDEEGNPSSATSTLSRVVQGAAQKSPSCDDWPFAVRSKKSETKGQELFAAVDAMMRGYDGPKPSPRKPKPRPASLPPVVPEVSASQWPPKPPKESPAASAQSSETALDGMAGSKCSCCGSDRPPQTDAEAEKEELLAAHGRIQNLEVQQTKLSGEQAMMQNLQSENTELQRRLEVFYKAMEFEADERDAHPTEQQDLTPKGVVPPSPEIEAVASIRQKIEKFHSQLVLEAVTLRNEVARLKKKKWIIKAVLDNGGEHERQAIVEEVAQLRSKREVEACCTELGAWRVPPGGSPQCIAAAAAGFSQEDLHEPNQLASGGPPSRKGLRFGIIFGAPAAMNKGALHTGRLHVCSHLPHFLRDKDADDVEQYARDHEGNESPTEDAKGKDLAPAPAPRRLKPCRWLLALFSLMIGGCVEREVDFAYYKDDMDIFNYMDEKEENLRRLEHVCQGGWEPSVVLARFALSVEERHHWRNFDMGKAPCGVRNLGELMDGGVKFDNRSMAEETVPGYVTALSCVDDAPVLIVDEMASLAIPTLHQLLSSRAPLVLLLGTLSGAEGTGAAVQEKVFKELGADSAEACHHATLPPGVSKRQFVKLSLQEAVRYKPGDPVESWLDSLLFLDMPSPPTDPKAYGTVGAARLMEIDTGSSNPLLASVMGLLRGHYRTSPNDLARLVSDAHIRTFALVANGGQGPPAVAVVAIEETPERLGKGTAKVHQTHLLAHGVEKEYRHLALARLSGLRPWRVVAAPALRGRGFGQKALELLEAHARDAFTTGCSAARFDWLGVSFGLTAQLFRFWSRAGYRPVVMSNTPNDQTGEMSIKMLLPISAALQRALPAIMPLFGTSFYRRLPTCFRPSAHLVNAFAALHLFEFCASKQNDTLGITSQQVIWIQCWWWRSWRCAQRQIQAPGKPHLWKLPNWKSWQQPASQLKKLHEITMCLLAWPQHISLDAWLACAFQRQKKLPCV